MPRISVLVVDRERTFADKLAARLAAEASVAAVAALPSAAAAGRLIAGQHAAVVLLDGDLPGRAAARLCEELCGRDRPPRVVVRSSSAEPERIIDAVRAGATAWVGKDESLRHLLEVIRGVARGETWLPPAETGRVLALLIGEREQRQHSVRMLAVLTPREREVLTCLAQGAGRREVAQRLHLSANTVRTHMQNLMAKLGVHSTLEAVALSRPHLETAEPPPGRRSVLTAPAHRRGR